MAKMSVKLPKNESQFLDGSNKGDKPWDDAKVREDVMKLVSLRLSEPYILKLQWISEQTGIPQQRLLRDWLLPLIDEKVEELSR